MKVLICGASGLVGRDLAKYLSEQNIEWVGTYFSRPCKNSIQLDFMNSNTLKNELIKIKPTHCVNCIAERAVDACENKWQQTKEKNIDIVTNLAFVCKELEIKFLHISTDYVFDGVSPPYLPNSPPNPLQSYGISKLIAELRIQSIYPDSTIIRVPVLYTDSYHDFTETAVTLIGKKVIDFTIEHKEDNYCIRRPVFIPDLCSFIFQCIETDKKGVLHFYNAKDKETKFTISKEIGKFLEKSTDHIQPVSTPPSALAGRPYDTQLFTADQKDVYPWTTSLSRGIEKCFQKLYHPPIIPGKKPIKDIFWMLDLDGTILDTDSLHLQCYNEAIKQKLYNFTVHDLDTLDDTIIGKVGIVEARKIRELKNEILSKTETIRFLPGSETLLEYFLEYNVNFCIVTNTSKQNVEYFQSKLPLLQRCKQWITKDDVSKVKPHPEPYQLAKSRYMKNEPYCVGVENTMNGYQSLKHSTQCIYVVCDSKSKVYTSLAKEDIYFIKDLSDIYTRVPTNLA